MIDVITHCDLTFINIFSPEHHCGRPSGDFVKTLICNQKLDLKPDGLRLILNNGYPNGVRNLGTYLGYLLGALLVFMILYIQKSYFLLVLYFS